MKVTLFFCIGLIMALSCASWAGTTYSWELNPSMSNYSVAISNSDVIEGLKVGNGATIEAGGFHGAFPQLNDAARLTDGQLGSGTDSVLQDFGVPSLKISYTFAPQKIWEVRSFGGNDGKDGRVFQNVDFEVMVGGDWFELVHEATTGNYNVHNGGQWEGSLIRFREEGGGPLAEGLDISGVRLTYWNVDNTADWFLPRDDVHAVAASIVKEIDVINTPVPEPASILAIATGLVGLVIRRKKN